MAAPSVPAHPLDRAPDDAEARLFDGLAAGVRALVAGAAPADALAVMARGVAESLAAPLVVVRAAEAESGELVAVALHAASDALAAEVEGSRLPAGSIGTADADLDAAD
ncbi:MAG TPA: hypothetical protein VK896_00155, partial [Gaiellaceae bacterium]|nr:hypothetical protein [Gaiellaceae bacterium]